MNLETFKARARRKLELPNRNSGAPAAPESVSSSVPASATTPQTEKKNDNKIAIEPAQHQANKMTPPSINNANSTAAGPAATPPDADRFAAALNYAAQNAKNDTGATDQTNVDAATPQPERRPSDPRSDNFASPRSSATRQADSHPTTLQSLTGSKATQNLSSDDQLSHLRSLLLGSEHETQQDQMDAVYRRTQTGIDGLRRDMDARLTDLSEYVEQLEQSLLNSNDRQSTALPDDTAQTLANHEQRLDSLDIRVTELLDKARAELDERRTADRDHLEVKLAAVTERNDRMLSAVSERLEGSMTDMQSTITEALSNQSSNAVTESAATISSLRSQLETLIDDRVRSLNGEQTSSMAELRTAMFEHTGSIKTELQTQTQQQSAQLATHRQEMEAQFNNAITALSGSKVSHKELSQLLSRLADRIQQL